MREVLKFLQANKVFHLATMDNGQPRVRPMGVALEYNGKITFCTGNFKKMYKQLKANPKIEISCCAPDSKYIRITGNIAFVTSDEARNKCYEFMPDLKKIFPDPSAFEIFSLMDGDVVYSDLTGKVRTESLY
jgi:uncharacterized pyridoxamine 5'-phosphate oxidase family protein